MSTVGFIGFGNMAKAIAGGMVEKGAIDKSRLYFHDPKGDDSGLGLQQCESNGELAKRCDYIILAVKPNMVDAVLEEITEEIRGKSIASIAAGVNLAHLKASAKSSKLLRIMPNTGARVGKSYTCFTSEHTFDEQGIELFTKLFGAIGKVTMISEKHFNVMTSVASSGVAFGDMLVESMADGGVLGGLPKKQAVEMATWAVLAACELILEGDKTPMQLKDEICSPGGTTVAAMKALEDGKFRSTVISAIGAATQRGNELI